jgi:predicted Na+-dependent transporter
VLAGAALGLVVRTPLAWMASHQAIDLLLAVLMLATALGIDPAGFAGLRNSWPTLLGAICAGIVVLPVLSWLAAQLVPSPLRDGVMTVGLAPCEIASVATTAMAAGDTALSAGVLAVSTLTTVLFAGPILSLEVGHAHLHPASIVANLAAVVALPFALGLGLRARLPSVARVERGASATAIASVAALVAVIASEVRLSTAYLSVGLAFALFIGFSALLGRFLALRLNPEGRRSLVLTTSMRDFAVAAALTAAAFGHRSAGPLGLYGILVLVWGTGAAGVMRSRLRRGNPTEPA